MSHSGENRIVSAGKSLRCVLTLPGANRRELVFQAQADSETSQSSGQSKRFSGDSGVILGRLWQSDSERRKSPCDTARLTCEKSGHTPTFPYLAYKQKWPPKKDDHSCCGKLFGAAGVF
jgi:hypothetical protein